MYIGWVCGIFETMTLDQSLVGRTFAPTPTHHVTEASIAAFSAAAGGAYAGAVAPPTYPIVLAFDAMMTFLDAVEVPLHRIVHGEQRFAYERPVVEGDSLVATLSVASLRTIGGNDIIGTSSTVTDAEGTLVCTATATLVHRGDDEQEELS